jgi:hypothetical protein
MRKQDKDLVYSTLNIENLFSLALSHQVGVLPFLLYWIIGGENRYPFLYWDGKCLKFNQFI